MPYYTEELYRHTDLKPSDVFLHFEQHAAVDSLRSAILLANFKNHILRRITEPSQTLWADLIN